MQMYLFSLAHPADLRLQDWQVDVNLPRRCTSGWYWLCKCDGRSLPRMLSRTRGFRLARQEFPSQFLCIHIVYMRRVLTQVVGGKSVLRGTSIAAAIAYLGSLALVLLCFSEAPEYVGLIVLFWLLSRLDPFATDVLFADKENCGGKAYFCAVSRSCDDVHNASSGDNIGIASLGRAGGREGRGGNGNGGDGMTSFNSCWG